MVEVVACFEKNYSKTSVLNLNKMAIALLLLTYLLLFIHQIRSQGIDCNEYIGYNQSTLAYVNGISYISYGSFYKNGTFINYNSTNKFNGNGYYIIYSSPQYPNECYTKLTWQCCGQQTGLTQCITTSITKDGNGGVGCWVYDTECIVECSQNKLGDGWFGTMFLNKLE